MKDMHVAEPAKAPRDVFSRGNQTSGWAWGEEPLVLHAWAYIKHLR